MPAKPVAQNVTVEKDPPLLPQTVTVVHRAPSPTKFEVAPVAKTPAPAPTKFEAAPKRNRKI